jgi:hypothetical protein
LEKVRILSFEKKQQKTFALVPAAARASLLSLARMQTRKSFLVLFFKKEHSF